VDRLKLYRLGVAGAAFIGTVAVAAVNILREAAVPEWWQALILVLAGGFMLRRPNGGGSAA
jgi:hypothetical protein